MNEEQQYRLSIWLREHIIEPPERLILWFFIKPLTRLIIALQERYGEEEE